MKGACVWCHKIVRYPAGQNPKDPKKDVVCSPECKRKEVSFRIHFSDEKIGARNYEEYGVNPNHRGKQ